MVKRYPELIEHLNKPFQIIIKTFVKRLDSGKNCLVAIVGSTGCQPEGNKVLMSNGIWKDVKNIKIGDEVLSPQKDGSNIFSKVIDITQWMSDKNFNIVEKNKNHKKLYSCSNNHIIPFYRNFTKRGTKEGKRYIKKSWWEFTNYEADTFSKMSNESKSHKHIGFSSFLIEKFKGMKNCEIEPYTLGVMLGDGMFRNKIDKKQQRQMKAILITSNNLSIIKEVSKHYTIISVGNKKGTTAKSYRFSINGRLSKLLTRYGLEGKGSGNKFIPKEALLSDSEYRKRLLAGLIDTDGYYAPKRGGYQFTLKSKQLIEDIRDLVYSLGGRCGEIKKVTKTIKGINFSGEYYSLSFYLGDLNIPLKLNRKKRDVSTIYLNSNRLAINSIRNDKKEMVYGFTLDSDSKWYITNNWMVTHNSGKSFASVCILYWTYIYMYGKPPTVDYSKEHWFFKSKDFLEAMNNPKLKKKELNLWDEMGVAASHKTHATIQNRAIGWLVQTFRNLEQLVIFTVPTLAYVDKTIRNLLHYQLETRKILTTDKICIIKPLEIQYNIRMDKTYYHNFFWKSIDGSGFMEEVDVAGIPLPPKELVEAYEKKSWAYKAELNKQIQGMLEKADEKEKKDCMVGEELILDNLTPQQKNIWNLLLEGVTESKDIAEILKIRQSTVCQTYQSLKGKGLDVNKILKNEKSEKPIFSLRENPPRAKLSCQDKDKIILNKPIEEEPPLII